MNTLSVQVDYATDSSDIPAESQFVRWAAAIQEHLEYGGTLCVRIVAADEMARLNNCYRGKQGLTNVLSFEADYGKLSAQILDENEDLRYFLGDIAICADVVNSESRAQNKQVEAHWAHLFVHGVLHLCGYDHEQDSDAEIMEALETKLMLELGYSAPYYAYDEIKTRVS